MGYRLLVNLFLDVVLPVVFCYVQRKQRKLHNLLSFNTEISLEMIFRLFKSELYKEMMLIASNKSSMIATGIESL